MNEIVRTISYTDVGLDTSPVIIFIHGFPFNKMMWKNRMGALVDNFRVIAYDILGLRNANRRDPDLSIDFFVHDLLELMDMLSIDKATLCGLSLGGYVALSAMESYPERFESILVNDINSFGDRDITREDLMRAIEHIRINGVKEYNDENLKILFSSESLAINSDEIAVAWKMIVKSSMQWHFNSIQDNVFPASGLKKRSVGNIVEY